MAKSHNDVTKMIDVFSQVVVCKERCCEWTLVVILRYSHRQGVRNSGTSCSLYMQALSLSTISAILNHVICSYLLCLGQMGALCHCMTVCTRQTASAKTSFGSTSMRFIVFFPGHIGIFRTGPNLIENWLNMTWYDWSHHFEDSWLEWSVWCRYKNLATTTT